uniref:sensor histidine kinase n=1 Tax=Sphingomonas bacterium TaxID=1895847 RepID=UPI001574F43C
AALATPPVGQGSFVPLGAVALGLPVVAEALRQAGSPAFQLGLPEHEVGLPEHEAGSPEREAGPPGGRETIAFEPTAGNGFPISDLVARIEAFQRQRDLASPDDPAAAGQAPAPATIFSFETDSTGTIRWVEGVERAPLIGLSLAAFGGPGSVVDGVAAGAFRRRAPFHDARFVVVGLSAAAGAWRIAAEPSFDPASGRFIGYRGTGRRPRFDESASPPATGHAAVADGLRQLVHELRTPTNAIGGFAELIESEMLGPVPAPYRARAATIRAHAADLIAAIDDLDTAARIEGQAMELRAGPVPLGPLLRQVILDCQPLAAMRGAMLSLTPVPSTLVLDIDDRAAERLLGRLLAALVSACVSGERLTIAAMRGDGDAVLVIVDRPAALAALASGGPLLVDAEREAAMPGAPLLGVGFALRLACNLAAGLGGALAFEPRCLTVRLPAAVGEGTGQTYAG